MTLSPVVWWRLAIELSNMVLDVKQRVRPKGPWIVEYPLYSSWWFNYVSREGYY